MRALVVYESFFGNTRDVAEAIGRGLRSRLNVTVQVCEVSQCPPLTTPRDLLVVGGPIHGWGMSREVTRADARRQVLAAGRQPVSPAGGVREWLASLPRQRGAAAAAFDTAMKIWLPVGSAASPEFHALEERGYWMVTRPEHFYVTDVRGPLATGELERARAWGARLVDALTVRFEETERGPVMA